MFAKGCDVCLDGQLRGKGSSTVCREAACRGPALNSLFNMLGAVILVFLANRCHEMWLLQVYTLRPQLYGHEICHVLQSVIAPIGVIWGP